MENVIILSPSKEMNEVNLNKKLNLNNLTQIALNELKNFSKEELKNNFNLSDEVSNLNYKRYQSTKGDDAINIYNGISFRNLNFNSLDDKSKIFLDNHLIILSALFGPKTPKSIIFPYRLDFTMPLTINKKSYKSLFKDFYSEYFKNKRVYNLASNEFSSLFKFSEVINFEFYKDFTTKKKAPTATTKKLRGLLARHIGINKNFSNDVLMNFKEEGYEFLKLVDTTFIYESKWLYKYPKGVYNTLGRYLWKK